MRMLNEHVQGGTGIARYQESRSFRAGRMSIAFGCFSPRQFKPKSEVL